MSGDGDESQDASEDGGHTGNEPADFMSVPLSVPEFLLVDSSSVVGRALYDHLRSGVRTQKSGAKGESRRREEQRGWLSIE
jgi:hypothetical protein